MSSALETLLFISHRCFFNKSSLKFRETSEYISWLLLKLWSLYLQKIWKSLATQSWIAWEVIMGTMQAIFKKCWIRQVCVGLIVWETTGIGFFLPFCSVGDSEGEGVESFLLITSVTFDLIWLSCVIRFIHINISWRPWNIDY